MTLILLLAGILLGVASLAWGYFTIGLFWVGAGLVLVGLIWMVAIWRGWRWLAEAWIGMTLMTLAAGFGLLLDLPLTWMLFGLVCGLLAWDLSNYYRQLRFVQKEDLLQMERSHMVRLGMFVGLALALGAGSLLLQTRLTFEWVMLLVLLSVWGISLMVKWLRKPEK